MENFTENKEKEVAETPEKLSEEIHTSNIKPENPLSVDIKIKELKKEIEEVIEAQSRIEVAQKVHNIPDDALIESDAKYKHTDVSELKEKLSKLLEEKNDNNKKRKFLGKIKNFFFSL